MLDAVRKVFQGVQLLRNEPSGAKNAKALVKAPKNQALTAAQDLEMGLHRDRLSVSLGRISKVGPIYRG